MNMKHGMIAGWAITVGMIVYGDITTCKTIPWPPRIVAAALVFGMLDIFSVISEELAGVVAIGIVLAAIVNKGFATNCNHAGGTVQPASYQTLDTPPTTLV